MSDQSRPWVPRLIPPCTVCCQPCLAASTQPTQTSHPALAPTPPPALAVAKLSLHLGIDFSACSHKRPREIPGSMVEVARDHRQAAVFPRPRQKKQAMVGQTSLQPHLRLGPQILGWGRCGFSSVPGPPPGVPAPKPSTLGQPQLPSRPRLYIPHTRPLPASWLSLRLEALPVLLNNCLVISSTILLLCL